MVDGLIPARSRTKFDKVFTLEQSLILKSLGRVSPSKLAQVTSGLISLLA
jgi:hypothetical protein